MELGPDSSPESLRQAPGDFTLLGFREGGVLLATGRSGGYRPIYVSWPSADLVIVCTHLLPLVELLPQRPRLDLEYLAASLLSYGPQHPEATPYAGVRRVPMGEAWVARPGVGPERWSTITPLLEPELRDDGHLAIRLRFAITEAVRRSARHAARLAVEVSGGLDSSMVLSILVSLARAGEISPPAAFTYESEVPSWQDDRPYLRSLESYLNIRVHKIMPADAANSLTDLMIVDGMPAPSTTLSAAKAIGTVARRQGVDVMLTGDGGDPVLDGNPRLFGELARKGKILRGLKGALTTRGGACFYKSRLERFARFFVMPLADPLLPESGLRAMGGRRRRCPPWAGPALARHLDGLASSSGARATLAESPGERYARFLRSPVFGPWSSIRLQAEEVGRYARRAPFFDDEFLRFAATLPPLSLMQGGFIRGLMREAMRGLVPEELRLRETKGTSYFFTEQSLAAAGGVDLLAGLADVRMLADLGFVEPRAFRTFFETFPGTAGEYGNYGDLWCVLSAEAFLRKYTAESRARAA